MRHVAYPFFSGHPDALHSPPRVRAIAPPRRCPGLAALVVVPWLSRPAKGEPASVTSTIIALISHPKQYGLPVRAETGPTRPRCLMPKPAKNRRAGGLQKESPPIGWPPAPIAQHCSEGCFFRRGPDPDTRQTPLHCTLPPPRVAAQVASHALATGHCYYYIKVLIVLSARAPVVRARRHRGWWAGILGHVVWPRKALTVAFDYMALTGQ